MWEHAFRTTSWRDTEDTINNSEVYKTVKDKGEMENSAIKWEDLMSSIKS